ncbi:bromodomain adjacent to zinc finger domain protein 1A isoform X2 [Hetaerina americana]|uniref:bromodomain adjacent to zinc finger domain protein 1A isoform X2 n=1 Tax=Hetaerina americana TaxID=62018 RepID=UPI003A7F1975
MPLLRKKPFEKKKPPPNLRPDEEVFHCKLTNELFRDYDEFYERIILCNSLIWSCSITGKPNITYAEALRSEASARNTLNEYPKALKLPVIYLASKTRRTCLRDLADDVYNFIRNRYFAGETVEVNLADGQWFECQILNVIAPSSNEIEEFVAKEGSGSTVPERDFWPPAALYQYEVRDISNRHMEDVTRFHSVRGEKVRRRKGSFTRERNRLFLRQVAVPFEDGIWGIKEDFISKHQITHARYSLLFSGPMPAFQDSSKKIRIPPSPTKFVGKSKSPRKSGGDSFVKSPTKESNKKLKTMELHPPSSKIKNSSVGGNKVKQRKRKIKDTMKGGQMVTEEGVGPKKKRLIQQKLTAQVMDMSKVKHETHSRPPPPKPLTEEDRRAMALKEKQQRIQERMNKRQMIKEEKRRLAEHLKEWNRPREDLECEDLKHLPAPSAIQCRIPNQLFGDFLKILEFVSCFNNLLKAEDYFPGGLTFDVLEKALMEKEGLETFADVVQLLLSSLFNLQEQEDDEVLETEIQAVVDLDVAGSTDLTREDAVQAATVATSWCMAYQGAPLKNLTLDCATLSEMVRLHILTSGGRCGERSSKWRYQQRGGYTNMDDPGLLLRLEEPHILRALSVRNIFDLSLGSKLRILNCLIDQILTYAAVRDVIDENVEKLKMAKVSLRHHQAGEIKKERDAAAARRKKRKEEMQKIKEGNAAPEKPQLDPQSPKRDEVRRKQELLKKEKELQEAIARYQILARATPLGRDRAYRRFWVFHSLPGLFVEDIEEWAGSCLPSATPHNPMLALANDQEEALACVQRLFEERGGNGSDKENEGSERGLTSGHKKQPPPLSLKNEAEKNRGTMVSRMPDSHTGSDMEEDEVRVKLAKNLVCVADSKACHVHSTFLPRTQWAFYSQEAELDSLVGALNPRGLREGHLRQVLLQQRTRILASMTKCPAHKLDHTKTPEIINEPRKSGRQQTKKEISGFNFSSGLPTEEIFELTLRDYILDMEDKITMGGFGMLKVKDAYAWREALGAGKYDQQCDKLVWGNKDCAKELKETATDKTVYKLKNEGKISRPDTPDTTSVSSDGGMPSYEDPGGHLSIIKLEEGQNEEDENGTSGDGSSDLVVKPIVKQLASAILQVAQCIEHRYLKKPLGEDQKSQEKRMKAMLSKKKIKEEEGDDGSEDGRDKDDIMSISSPMERWETSLMASTSLSQLYLHFYTLDNSIQWSKSALYARCRICRKQGDGENMLLCDGCNKGYHLYCLKPRLNTIPLGDWFCPACRPLEKVQPPRKSRRLFSEESEEEAEEEEEEESEDEEESEESSIPAKTCYKCGGDGDMACCSSCPLAFHMNCTDPPLRKIPRGSWSCPKCKPHHFSNQPMGKRERSPCAPQRLPITDDAGLHFPWREGRHRNRRWGDEWQGWGQGTGPWWDDSSSMSRRRQCATAAVAKISSIAKRLRSNSWDDTDSNVSGEDRAQKMATRRKRMDEQEDDDEDDLEERRRRSASLRGQRRMRRSELFDGIPAPLDLDVLESLLADISRHADAWPFMRPVLKSEAPDYHVIIKRPMDFGTMKYKLKIMEYKNNNEFLADALLVFENCQMYNNNSAAEYKAGVRLSRYFEKRCKELQLTLHEVERSGQNGKFSRRS